MKNTKLNSSGIQGCKNKLCVCNTLKSSSSATSPMGRKNYFFPLFFYLLAQNSTNDGNYRIRIFYRPQVGGSPEGTSCSQVGGAHPPTFSVLTSHASKSPKIKKNNCPKPTYLTKIGGKFRNTNTYSLMASQEVGFFKV